MTNREDFPDITADDALAQVRAAVDRALQIWPEGAGRSDLVSELYAQARKVSDVERMATGVASQTPGTPIAVVTRKVEPETVPSFGRSRSVYQFSPAHPPSPRPDVPKLFTPRIEAGEADAQDYQPVRVVVRKPEPVVASACTRGMVYTPPTPELNAQGMLVIPIQRTDEDHV